MNPLLFQNMMFPTQGFPQYPPMYPSSLVKRPQASPTSSNGEKKIKIESPEQCARPVQDPLQDMNALFFMQEQQRHMQNMFMREQMANMATPDFGLSNLLMGQMPKFPDMQALMNTANSMKSQKSVIKPVVKNNLELPKKFNNTKKAEVSHIKDLINIKHEEDLPKGKVHDEQDDKQSQTTQESNDLKYRREINNESELCEDEATNIKTPLCTEGVDLPVLVEYTTAFPEWDLASIFGYLKHGEGKSMGEFEKERKSVREKKINSRKNNKLEKKKGLNKAAKATLKK